MSKMVIFDPAMCCSTGVCSPSVDQELLRVAAVLENLKKAGIEVARRNLSAEPQAFMRSEAVANALNKNGAEALPITMVDGKIVKSGSYPTNEEFAHLLGVSLDSIKTGRQSEGEQMRLRSQRLLLKGKTDMDMELYNPAKVSMTKYLFFTGKGGVEKTSIACATAVALVDSEEKVLLVSTDPASNLQGVFGISKSEGVW